MGSFSLLVIASIVVLNISFARRLSGENDGGANKFLKFQKERMDHIQNAMIKYRPLKKFDYQYGSDDLSGLDYLEEQQPDESQYGLDPELNPNLPYNIQNVRNIDTSEIKDYQRRDTGGKSPHFQPLCETHRRTVHLSDIFYDYRPNHYDEVHCVYPYVGGSSNDANVCNEGGFHCIQLNRTIFVTRRAKGSSCWEMENIRVASGCECMWPAHKKGDIQFYQ